jgi:hypothetical protein
MNAFFLVSLLSCFGPFSLLNWQPAIFIGFALAVICFVVAMAIWVKRGKEYHVAKLCGEYDSEYFRDFVRKAVVGGLEGSPNDFQSVMKQALAIEPRLEFRLVRTVLVNDIETKIAAQFLDMLGYQAVERLFAATRYDLTSVRIRALEILQAFDWKQKFASAPERLAAIERELAAKQLQSSSGAFGIDLPDGAIIIFGPNDEKTTAGLVAHGMRGLLIARRRLDTLVLPAQQVCGLTLIFAHCIPTRKGHGKTERDMQEWAAQLMNGAGFTTAAFHHPDIKWFGDKADDKVDLKLFWEKIDSQECLRIAKTLESSFLKYGGADSYG